MLEKIAKEFLEKYPNGSITLSFGYGKEWQNRFPSGDYRTDKNGVYVVIFAKTDGWGEKHKIIQVVDNSLEKCLFTFRELTATISA